MTEKKQRKAADDLARVHSVMNEDEFFQYIAEMVVIGLGCIYASQGKEFHDDFLQGAKQNPLPIRFAKVNVQ